MKAPRRFLDVTGELDVASTQGKLRLDGRGARIVIALPDLALGFDLLRAGSAGRRRVALQRLDGVLRRAGLGLDVTVKDEKVARLGKGASPGALDRFLGLAPVQVRVRSLVRALLGR